MSAAERSNRSGRANSFPFWRSAATTEDWVSFFALLLERFGDKIRLIAGARTLNDYLNHGAGGALDLRLTASEIVRLPSSGRVQLKTHCLLLTIINGPGLTPAALLRTRPFYQVHLLVTERGRLLVWEADYKEMGLVSGRRQLVATECQIYEIEPSDLRQPFDFSPHLPWTMMTSLLSRVQAERWRNPEKTGKRLKSLEFFLLGFKDLLRDRAAKEEDSP